MADKWIYWLEELNQGHNDLVGKKCANLGEMTKLGMKIPPGFAITVDGYQKFMELTGLRDKIQAYFTTLGPELRHSVAKQMQAGRTTQQMIRETPVPEAIAEEIARNYRVLCERCGRPDLSVAVRSSGAVSMPGQMETYLNVQGEQDVIRRVVEVWESTFTTRAIAFRLEKGMPVDQAPIGVAVIKMVNARSAGVVLTVIPTTADVDRVVIEGNWGLGESVVSGDITPDNFIVEKASRAIEKKIAHKNKWVVFNGRGTMKGEVPLELRDLPCLEDPEILEIVRIAQNVEGHFGVPQDMEWVIDKDLPFPNNVFWVQARAAKFTPKKKDADVDYLVDQMARLFKL
ncbi:MAG: PEP/pyruvate-binding domain-containing protein [Deltaproteobacteria bacterium]|nr:PEP/pyruvate-binding domain-containing protein [Deltaproteobacteria bacterium]